MIDARELRIGNFLFNQGYLHEVNADDIDFISRQPDNDWYKPIKLTVEIMVKLGFEKKEEFCGGGINELLISYGFDGYYFMEDVYGNWFLIGYNWNTEHFKWLHQLQNIFYCLSGTELEVEL